MARIITEKLINELMDDYHYEWIADGGRLTIETGNKCYTKTLIVGEKFVATPSSVSIEHTLEGMENTMEDIEEYTAIMDYIERWFRLDEVRRRVGR